MAVNHRAADAASCFLLTDIRMVEAPARSTLIDSISGRNLTLKLTHPPRLGSLVEVNLGDMGWVDGVVRWTGGTQTVVELQRDINSSALFGHETSESEADGNLEASH